MSQEEMEELTNGLDEHPEETYETAKVVVGVRVADVVGRVLETDEEKQLFLTLLDTFFKSDMVYENLKMFVQFYMNEQAVPQQQQLIVPDKPKIILP